METTSEKYPPVPADDLSRTLTLSRLEEEQTLPHIGVVGDTYTITIPGAATADRFCVIDMHVPPGGGPPPHRHNFEESFILLKGEMEATFRGEKMTVRAGDTLHIPANAPHQLRTRPHSQSVFSASVPRQGRRGSLQRLGYLYHRARLHRLLKVKSNEKHSRKRPNSLHQNTQRSS